MRRYLLLFALTLCALAGCRHDADTAQCCAGTVPGTSCYDGVIVYADAQFPAGRPVGEGPALHGPTNTAN